MKHPHAVLPLALALAGPACLGTIGGEEAPEDTAAPAAPERGSPRPPPSATSPVGTGAPASGGACAASQVGASPLLRLTATQYRNTVRDLLAGAGARAAIPEVEGPLASVPPDVHPLFTGLDGTLGPDHVLAYFRVASAAADAIAGRPERLAAVAGACATATALATACLDEFLARFGRRAFRRPLEDDELGRLRALHDGRTPPAEVLRSVIVSLLTAPAFLTHLELRGTPLDGREDDLLLSPWEIAARLSYTLWQTMPDEALLQAAADGSLATDAGFQRQLGRMSADPRARDTVWQFWSEWLRLEGYFFGFDTSRPAFRTLAAGERIGEPGRDHHGDMVREIRELTEHVAFTRRTGIVDLLLTDLSLTRSPDLARLYRVPAWDGRSEPPRFGPGERAGLLTRAALLVVGEEQTNPFHRGAIIRRRLLCDPLPSPDPNSLPAGALDTPPPSPGHTTRQRFEAKMLDSCRPCHAQFNDIGYVLEAYDPLGRSRATEKIFDSAGRVVAELPIDVTGVPRIELADQRPVNGPIELSRRVADSGKVEPCFARSFATYALRRPPANEEACAVEALAEAARAGGLAEVYRRVALQPGFRRRKVGAP